MELRDFISAALLDIVGAVQDAQAKTPPGTIVPSIQNNSKTVGAGISSLQSVEFEVTVSADKRTGSEAKLNVVAAIIGGGVAGETAKSAGHVACLKFYIPWRLPASKAAI